MTNIVEVFGAELVEGGWSEIRSGFGHVAYALDGATVTVRAEGDSGTTGAFVLAGDEHDDHYRPDVTISVGPSGEGMLRIARTPAEVVGILRDLVTIYTHHYTKGYTS